MPSIPFENEVLRDYTCNENRYRMLAQSNPQAAWRPLEQVQQAVLELWRSYEHMARMYLGLGVVPGAREEVRDG